MWCDLGGPVPRMSPALCQLSYGGISLEVPYSGVRFFGRFYVLLF